MARGWRRAPAAALVALALAGCDASDDDRVAFEVVARTARPAIARTAPGGAAAPAMPGAEVAMAAVAHSPREVRALWDQVGFDEPVPALADDEALLVVGGGKTATCPWTVDAVEAEDSQPVAVHLRVAPSATGCARTAWQPHALALTLPAAALPAVDRTHEEMPVMLHTDSRLLSAGLPSNVWGADPTGPPPWSEADTRFAYRESRAGSRGAQLAADPPIAVTSFPGFDVIHLRFASRQGARVSASYVADPPVAVTGDAFLRLQVGPAGASPRAMPRHVDAPAQAAITEIVRLPDARVWIVGLDGAKTSPSLRSHSYDLPRAVGSAYLIGLPHRR